MQDIGHWINGKMVAGTSGRAADVMNPATGEVQAKVALATVEELNDAVAKAAEAQVAWGATNPQRRARVMMNQLRSERTSAYSLETGYRRTSPMY